MWKLAIRRSLQVICTLAFLSGLCAFHPLHAESAEDQNKQSSIESPRFMVRQFLDFMKRDDIEGALAFVEFPRPMNSSRKKVMVRQLFDVLNKRGQVDIAKVSDDPNGRLTESLLPDAEIIGKVSFGGQSIPIELRRMAIGDEERRWRFAAEFMEKIPSIAENLDERAFELRMPPALVEYSSLGIKLWQWLGLLVSVIFAFFASSLLALVLIRGIDLASRHYYFRFSDELLKRFVFPLRWINGVIVFQVLSSFLEIRLNVRQSISYMENVAIALAITFFLMRLIEAFIELARSNFEKQGKAAAGGMLLPIQKGAKILVIAGALIWIFRDLGFDVTAIMAGLGVGGLAVALAGQKTIENLFGGISVLLDQPVRVGDSGRFGDIVGSVEDIGLRSTKVRTLDRTLVTIPNAEFSLMKIENYERRDKMRWQTILGIRYETRADQMRLLLMRLKELLVGHPKVLNEPARVRLVRLGADGLEIEIFCFIAASEQNEYLAVVEDLNLKILELVEECGTSFAFPSSTIYLERSAGIDLAKQEKALETARRIKDTHGFPQPNYPPEWVEPRVDTLVFGPTSSRKEP